MGGNGPEVLPYASRGRRSKMWTVKFVGAWLLTGLATLFVLTPSYITMYSGGVYQTWFGFGTFGSIHKEFRRGMPPIVDYEFHWPALLWTLLFLMGIWAACIYFCRALRRQ